MAQAQPLLELHGLRVAVDGQEIVRGLNLVVRGGEVHAIMGPNGTGKSTLAQALMGHPQHVVTGGRATLDGANLLELSVDARTRAGLFLAMQHPSEVPGVPNADFLRLAVNARRGQALPVLPFHRQLLAKMQDIDEWNAVAQAVHQMRSGRIVRTGGKELVQQVEAHGYDGLTEAEGGEGR